MGIINGNKGKSEEQSQKIKWSDNPKVKISLQGKINKRYGKKELIWTTNGSRKEEIVIKR